MHFFTFHVGDWLKKTGHLNHTEVSIYLRLILHYYETELPLPLDTKALARKLRLLPSHSKINDLLAEFFTKTPDGWRHERCEKELIEIYDKSEKAREAANKRWESKRNADAMRSHSEGNATTMLPNTHNPIPTNPIPKVSAKAPKRTLDYSCWPEMPQQQTLDDWLAMRKRIKADVSQTVINQFGTELQIAYAAGVSVDHCLATCVTSNWRGFKYSWLKNQEASNATNQRQPQQTRGERNEQAFRDYIAGLDAQEDHGSVLAGLIGPATGN